MTETIITNARLILEDDVVDGTIIFGPDGIRDVASGPSRAAGAIDAEGDFISPGIVEMHTDNMEKHFVPRPGVFWPNGLAAAMAHDAQMAAAGVTTVFDSLCTGTITGKNDYRRTIFPRIMNALTDGSQAGIFRIDHRVHLRCELTGDNLLEDLEPFVDHPLVSLASLMDHTPGQRQWRNLEDLKRYNMGTGEKTLAEHQFDVAHRMEQGPVNVRRNWPLVVEMFRSRGIPLATHDDTTEEDVSLGLESGAVISEFPTTVAAAQAAKRHGLATIAGAPNVVRGGSHSGGVAAGDLAERGLLDGLSSDYVPASLIQAVIRLTREHGLSLPQAMSMVTWRVADMVGLVDRGHLKPGLRSDILRFRVLGDTPIVVTLWSAGARAY